MTSVVRPTRRRRRSTIGRVAFWGAAILLVVAAMLGYKVWRVYERADALRQDLRALEAAIPKQLSAGAFAALPPLVDNAHNDALALQAEAVPLLPIAAYLGWVPRYGTDIAAAEKLVSLAVDATDFARTALDVGVPLLREREAGRSLPDLVTNDLHEAQPKLLHMRSLFPQLEQTLGQIPIDALEPALREPLRRLAALLPQMGEALDLASVAPALLGADGPRTYLLLFQDPKELRATGGFIGGVGAVTVEKGRISALQVEGSESIDDLATKAYPDPPRAMFEYMSIELWLFRDSNWSPDFPTSARAAMQSYKLGRNRQVDGVVAIDPLFVQAALRVVGPVVVEGEAQPIGADTVLAYMDSQYDAGFPRARKAFIAPLARAIKARVETGKLAVDVVTALHLVRQALDERHALIYVNQPEASALLGRRGWDGAVQPGAQDFLMAVDSNVGYNKVNGSVQQAMSYTVHLETPTAPWAEATLQYRNAQPAADTCTLFNDRFVAAGDQRRGCYWDYLRLLLPHGSALITAQVQTVPGDWLPSGYDERRASMGEGEAGASEFSTIMTIRPGLAQTVSARYTLPTGVVVREGDAYHYRLRLQKQPRADDLPVRVVVVLPRNAVLVASTPPAALSNGQLRFDLRLSTDQPVDVLFR